MNIKELFLELDPISQIEFKEFLKKNLITILGVKDANAKIINQDSVEEKICSKCGEKIYKNGKTKNGIQKYICSKCKKTFSITTNTITYHSKLSFDVWKSIIDNLIDGFSIRRIAEENKISIPTSFKLRHKVLRALKTYTDDVKLKGKSYGDEKYFPINLKGTKPENMPRFSKPRTSKKSAYRGISHHKVCVVTATDEYDNMVMKITGLGRVTTAMVEDGLGSHVEKVKDLTADSANAYPQFCKDHNINLIAIPSGSYADGINNLAEINCIHSQLETWLSKFRGVSIRHLQDYLNWFNFIYTMKKRYTLKMIRLGSYKSIITNNNYIKANDIFSIDLPIDLKIAYAEYNYQSLC